MSIAARRIMKRIRPLASGVLWGAYIDGRSYGAGYQNAPWDDNTWNKFETNAGKKVSILHYGSGPWWTEPFAPWVADKCVARGSYPFVDMMSEGADTLANIAAGARDAELRVWAQAVKDWGKPLFFRWNGEMNGNWRDYGLEAHANPGVFVNAWRHIHDIVTAEGATNVTWVWCPNVFDAVAGTTYTPTDSSLTPIDQLYPGDAYVDWVAMDGYNWTKSGGPYYPDWLTFSQVFNDTYQALLKLAPSKPIMIAEISCNEDPAGSKADWIRDALLTQLPKNFPKIKALGWFEWPIYENNVTQQWPIESSPAALAAFREGISSPYYLEGGVGKSYGSGPLLGKVPVPK